MIFSLKVPWNQKYLEDLSFENNNNNNNFNNNKNSSISLNEKNHNLNTYENNNNNNSQEKEIIELCKALKNMSNQIDIFFEENKLHKLYLEESTFYDLGVDNDRFCKFCLIRKVLILIFIFIYLLY
jgi:hypothetical protein